MRKNIIQGDAVSFFEKVSKLFTAGQGSTESETAVCDLKGIKTGEWVESVYLKGYFKVYQIKHCYREGKNEGYLLLLKKIKYMENITIIIKISKIYMNI